MEHVKQKTMRQRVVAMIAAGALAASMAAMPGLAFAVDNSPSQVGSGTNGTGNTTLKIITKDDGSEHSETSENVAFTFPSQINYVVDAAGTLTGPSSTATYIQNGSEFPIHVSSIQVTPSNNWHFQDTSAKITSESTNDNVYLKLGPTSHEANLANFTTKATVPAADAAAWNMAAKSAKVGLGSTGNVGKVTQDITTTTEFGQVTWYVTAGSAS